MDLSILKEKSLKHHKKMQEIYEFHGGEGNPVTPLLEEYDRLHPGLDAWALKKAQYEILAENMETVIFPETPFYFLNNLFFRDGTPRWSAAGWLSMRNTHIFRDADPETFDHFEHFKNELRAFSCCGPYVDRVHFCYPVAHVVEWGLRGAYERIEKAKIGADEEALRFYDCAQAGLLAAKRIAERFGEKARGLRSQLTDPALIHNMDLLISASAHAPWEPCATFFEGLNTMWFCRDVMGVIDGIGNSHLGRPDVILEKLYENDLAVGRLTPEKAYALVCQFILLGDTHYDKDITVREGADHEMEMGLVLGGCDGDGNPVFNAVTKMFLRAHREMNAIYPKLHCRLSADSPEEYLEMIASDFASGRSVIGLSYDEGYIPALLHDGLSLEDARGYVNTGCWSSISEGNESVPGGNYLYLVNLLEKSVYGAEPEFEKAGLPIEPLEGARSFEELYDIYMGNLRRVIRWRNNALGKYGPLGAKVNPLALASAFLSGCVESGRDFTQGGARYNRNTVDISGFANAIDALLAMKKLCFEDKIIPLTDYLSAVRQNWAGHEELLCAVRHAPHFGDQSPDTAELTKRLHRDLYESLSGQKNERGGAFSLNFYVYREFILDAANIRATPDGRRDGELYALGVGPSRYHPADPLTAVIATAGSLDPALANVTALDIRLPAGQTDVKKLALLLRTFAHTGIKHLQLNVVNAETLLDAREHPEKYEDLIVRVCGFSAKFVKLAPYFQDEVIRRTVYET